VIKKVMSLAIAALAVAAVAAPAFAADDNMDKVVQGALLPTRVGGVAAGVVVGTPIAIVRQSVKGYKDLTEKCADKIGGKDCGPACLLVSVVTLPAGLVYGGATGTYYGMKNGIMDGFQTPFHPDSFSVNKLEE
jgi:hypothetical protein